MKTVQQLGDLRTVGRPVVLAAGFFDGVHRGHLRILGTAIERARSLGGEAWALTFDPHPAKVLTPERAPSLLTSSTHKMRLLARAGVDGCIMLPFTRELAEWAPEFFLQHVRECVPTLRATVVGKNWRFGRARSGDVELLGKMAVSWGWEAVVVEEEMYRGAPISSTRIRSAVASGQLAEAADMLGRRFSISGTVVAGKKVGRTLGYPTINLDPHNEVRPPPGIYAVWADVRQARYGGAAFLADLPHAMKGPSGFLLEVHLLDFEGDVYGEEAEIHFVQWIRESLLFDNTEDLKAQIARDVNKAKGILDADDIAGKERRVDNA